MWGAVAGLVVAAVVLVVAGGFALHLWQRRWLLADLPTSDAAHVFVGMNEVEGRAVANEQPIVAPYSAVECVWCRSLLEREVTDGDDRRRWKTESDDTSTDAFWIEDDSGRVLVRPEDASVYAREKLTDTHPGRPARHGSLTLLHTLGGGGSLLGGSLDARYRTTEWVIRPGEPIFVLGEASLRQDAVALEFAPCEPGGGTKVRSVLISSGDEQRVARRTGWQSVGLLLLSMAAAAAIPLAWEGIRRAREEVPLGAPSPLEEARGAMVIAALLVLAVLPVLFLVRLYNRLVAARNRVEAAWSLIDVQLRRRHDLLPALADVVAAAAAHERDVHERVAALRGGPALPPATANPDRAAVAGAEAVDVADADRARRLVALAEAYPDLRAGDQYRRLAAELTAAEDGIAFARTFFNDAVTVARDRRQQFPGLLVAPLVPAPAVDGYRPGEPDARPAAAPPVVPSPPPVAT